MDINWLQILAGFGFGLIYSELRDRIRERQTKAKIRSAIAKLFYFNLERCLQMQEQLTVKQDGTIQIPSYPFDTDAIKQVMFNGLGTFKSDAEKGEFDAINWQRYQLDHLNYKLSHINLSNDKEELIREFQSHLSRERKDIELLLGRLK